MYDIDDKDLAGFYDQKKTASKQRTPALPKQDCKYTATLLRVAKEITEKAGKQYVFRFRVDSTNDEILATGGIYKHVFYCGNGGQVDSEKFWSKITPLLMSVFGETSAVRFNSLDKLGELLSLCNEDPALELGFPFNGQRKMAEAQPDKKSGKIPAEFILEDGSPMKFARDDFFIASAPVATPAAA